MSIRRILLFAFLALSFLATTLLAVLAFFASREALEREIGIGLRNDAVMLMEQIDMLMFERLQNVHSWSHLDIMQEARIGDVDKRLARFLAELEQGYGGVYRELFYVDHDRRIVAASNPELIGHFFDVTPAWVQTSVPNDGEVFIEPLRLEPPYQEAALMIRAPVTDSYQKGELGHLYGSFDLQQIFRLFDQYSHSSSGERFVALLDQDGRIISASQTLRDLGLLLSDKLAGWRPSASGNDRGVRAGAPLSRSKVLVGYAASGGFQGYAKTGWSLLVVQTTKQAFRPIHALWWLFCIAFAATALVAGWSAQAISAKISFPLIGLTNWARQYTRSQAPLNPVVSGAREVRELGKAFGQMVEDLEHSRQQVVRAAKLAVVGEMAAIMAHEVRTPLGILHTTAQMLQREVSLSPQSQDMARLILEETSRLNRLISTLLDCARPRPPQMRMANLHEILERVIELLKIQAQKKQVRIERKFLADRSITACDEELMVQVFLNLIMNSIQLLPSGGRIVLRTSSAEDRLKIEVSDNGPGIPDEHRSRVFDPFFTTREGGIGLGLTVTQQSVAAHGGTISVASNEWGGACFAVVLPVRKEPSL